MKKYLSTIGVSLMLAVTATTPSAATLAEEGVMSDRYDSLLGEYKSALTEADSEKVLDLRNQLLLVNGDSGHMWEYDTLRAVMKEAFEIGNITGLKNIKSHNEKRDLRGCIMIANINDLGEPFFKYGAGMGKWDQLIEDATANQAK